MAIAKQEMLEVAKQNECQTSIEVYTQQVEKQKLFHEFVAFMNAESDEDETYTERLEDFITDMVEPWSKQNHRDSKGFIKRVEKLKRRFGHLTLAEVRKKHIMLLLNEIAPTVQSPTLGKYLSAFSKVFGLAIAFDYLDKNPCQGLPRPKNNPPRNRVLEPIEVNAAIEALLQDENPVQALAILLCLFTGLRQGNVISIELSWFSHDYRTLNIPITKSGKPQQVALNSVAHSVVLEALKHTKSKYLFTSKTGVTHLSKPTTCMDRVRDYMKKKGVLNGHFTCHDLRRSFGTYQLRTCGDIRLVQQSLGHADCKTTQIYTYHADERLLEASEQTASALLNGAELKFKRS